MPKHRNLQAESRKHIKVLREAKSAYGSLPSFASTSEEIRLAVEQNALDRGVLLIKVMASLQIDSMLNLVDAIARAYDMEDYYQTAAEAHINTNALDFLSAPQRQLPFPYYFCLPADLIAHPELIFYYRNVAMLSAKVMRGIGLDTQHYEVSRIAPSEATALELARYFNGITSNLVLQGGATPYRHLEMMMANLGDSLGGVSRNEVGRVAMGRILGPLIQHLADKGRITRVRFSLKGRIISPEDEEGSGASSEQSILIGPETDIVQLMQRFDTHRVIYHELEMVNGSRLLLNRQFTWYGDDESYRIGPDMTSQLGSIDMLWAGELKGGADPGGSDEHWKTATQALQRIIEATQKTNRPQPQLSFMATILVERVAREAQDWIERGRLTSVYNLTKMRLQPEEMQRYLHDMNQFLGFDLSDR